MSLIDQAMKANKQFSSRYDPKLGGHPQPKIAIFISIPCGGLRGEFFSRYKCQILPVHRLLCEEWTKDPTPRRSIVP